MTQSIRERFPKPWSVEQTEAGFRVTSANGYFICYVYAYDDLRRAIQHRRLTLAEAKAIARAIAELAGE